MPSKVGLVLALDGEKEFSRDLRSASETVKLAKQALSSVDEKYYGAANSMAALTEKSKALSTVQDSLKNKLNAATGGLEKANENYDKISHRLDNTRSGLERLKGSFDEIKAKYGENSAQAKAYGKAIEQLEERQAGLEHQQDREQKSMLKWQTAVNKATGELKKCDQAIEDNNRYLDEADQSADKCATSIDGFGRKVKGAGKDADEAKEKVKSFGEMIGERLSAQMLKQKAFDMVCDGLRRIGRAAIDATKDMIKTGMEFDAQMSRVKAISGSTSAETKQLTDKAKQLGLTTVYTATESASAMEQLALAGWRTESIISGIDGVLALASSSSMDLATAATYVSDNLNAYGLSADKAGELSDVMAYAMSNASMTTTDLGEAYGKVAATAAAYGYNYKEVTAVLMTMANAGKKGGEAGTALNTIMTRLSTNTSKCSEAIMKYNGGVDIMYDSTGRMRPLTDVLTDLYDVWVDLDQEQQNALAKQIAGVRQGNALFEIMAGMEQQTGATARSFSEYASELDTCQGAAQRMADVSLDNLAGDVELMNDAFDSLKITLEGKLDAKLRDAVQGITKFINGITSAIEGQKTELDSFIDDIQESNEEVDKLLGKASQTLTGAEVDVAELEQYKDILVELNSQEELTEYQKFQLRNAVNALAGAVPELAAAFDEESGRLKLTNSEIESLITNSENLAIKQALIASRADSMEAYADAYLNTVKANSAVYEALQQENERFGTNYQSMQDLMDGLANGEIVEFGIYKRSVDDLNISTIEAINTQRECEEQLSDVEEEIKREDEAYAGLKEELGLTEESIEGMIEAENGATDSTGALTDANEQLTESQEEAAALAEEEAKRITDAYESMKESVSNSITGMVALDKEWSQGDSIGVDKMISNLDKQIEGLGTWKANMATLAEQTGDGFSQSLYDKLVEMGPEAANLVQDIVNSMGEAGDTTKLKELSQKWEEAMALGDDSSATQIAQATSEGKELAQAISDGFIEATGEWDFGSEVSTKVSEGTEEAISVAEQNGTEIGTSEAEAFTEGIESSDATGAGVSLAQQAADGAGSMRDGFVSKGEDAAAGYAQGIRNGSNEAVNAASEMAAQAIAAAAKAQASASPSKKFKKLGNYATDGYALGISQGTTKVTKASANMAKKAGKAASNALVEAGFTEKDANEIQKKINKAFSVSWYSGSGKKKKKKDAETYYKDIYNAAKKYIDNKSKINDLSYAQEEAYWTKVLAKLKTGTQAWYDAKKQIAKVKQDIIKDTAANQDAVLDYYKVYNKVSMKAEMQYWDQARKSFQKGTKERIEADEKYLKAKDAYYEELIKLEEDYAEQSQEIYDTLSNTVEDLTETYQESVKSRKEEIMSSMNLFDEFTSEGFRPDKLIRNLESQVEALELWEESLAAIKERGVSEDLYDMLLSMGPESVASIYSISQMTDEQLAEYEDLLAKKSKIATDQALKDNDKLLKDTNIQIQEANRQALEAQADLDRQYQQNLSELSSELPSDLQSMLTNAGSKSDELVAAMFKGYDAIKSSDTKLDSLTTDIADRLSGLSTKTADVGTQALDSLLSSLTDKAKINTTVHSLTEDIRKAFEYEGVDGLSKLTGSIDTANAATSGIVGTVMLNDLASKIQPQIAVKVDSDPIISRMNEMVTTISGVVDAVRNLSVVLESGEVIGYLSDGLNTSLGAAYSSSNRGTLR